MTHDRLGDEFMTEVEIVEHDKLVLASNRYSTGEPIQKRIVAYPMWNKQGNTKVVIIINTDAVSVMQETLNRDWAHTNMQVMDPVIVSDLEWSSDTRLDALYVTLDRWRFTTDIEASSADRLYKWKSWMKELV